MAATHTYATSLTWSGSTGLGYAGFDPTHRIVPVGSEPLTVSADPAFLGMADLPNPEALLLAAASSCQLLSFLSLAARARVDVVSYTDEAIAVMPEDDPPVRITQVVLRPQIDVRGADIDRVARLVQLAHETCYIANSLTAQIVIEPTIDVV